VSKGFLGGALWGGGLALAGVLAIAQFGPPPAPPRPAEAVPEPVAEAGNAGTARGSPPYRVSAPGWPP
jgi:hypothetical protein